MEKTVRLSSEQREDLVAYLDGELVDDKVTQIDQVIARSEVARHEVEALARTFELLDLLPKCKASDEFASNTISTLKVMEQPYSISDQWWYRYFVRLFVGLCWVSTIALFGWLGFQLTRNWIPNHGDQVLKDLPVIESLHQYREIHDFEFLRELKKSGIFDETQDK